MTTDRAVQPARRTVSITGRTILLLIVLGMLCVLAAMFHFLGAPTVWAIWAVPTKYSGLADLREVLQGIEAASNGAPGLVSGYPGIWALLGKIGLGANDTVAAAIIVYCGFAAGVFIFARRYSALAAVFIGAVIFSPAAMLGYERANLDLAMFALVALALWLDAASEWLPMAPIVLAAMLKVYPILGLGYLLKQPRGKFLPWTGIALSIFLIYLAFVGRGTQSILTEIPKGDLFAYGTGVTAFYLFRMGLPRAQTNVMILLSYAAVYLLALLMLFLSYKRGVHKALLQQDAPWLDAFRVGALIYIGTFIEGNSFNYRLLFLAFCIPQLAAWAQQASPVRREARATLIALIASCWCVSLLWFLPEAAVLALAQVASWALCAGLLYLTMASLPDWLFDEIQRFFEKHDRKARLRSPGSQPSAEA